MQAKFPQGGIRAEAQFRAAYTAMDFLTSVVTQGRHLKLYPKPASQINEANDTARDEASESEVNRTAPSDEPSNSSTTAIPEDATDPEVSKEEAAKALQELRTQIRWAYSAVQLRAVEVNLNLTLTNSTVTCTSPGFYD